MTPQELRDRPDAGGLPPALAALWWAARDEWERAHEAAQSDAGPDADWVHAYLHRVEGDLENAGYWYGRAKRPAATGALDAEWAAIAAELGARALGARA